MRRLNISKTISLSAMCIALGVLCLYAAAVLPTLKIAFLFLSSLFVYVISIEGVYWASFLIFIATGAIAFFISPDKISAVAFIFLFGHSGIFRSWINVKLSDSILKFVLRMIYLNIFLAVCIFCAVKFFSIDVTSMILSFGVSLWVVIAVIEAAFIAFDLLTWVALKAYIERFRSSLIGRR